MAHTSILSPLLQKVDIDLRTAVDCVNKLQSLKFSILKLSCNCDLPNFIYFLTKFWASLTYFSGYAPDALHTLSV